MAVVASKFSSVAGPAKWFAVGVVGTAGIAASIWAYASRSPVAPTSADKPPSVLAPHATHKNESTSEALAEKPFEPVLVARDVIEDATREPATPNGNGDAIDASTRPMIVHRSKMGPGVFEALPIPVNALEGSSVGNGTLGIFPTRQDLIPMRAPQNEVKRDGVGPGVESEQTSKEQPGPAEDAPKKTSGREKEKNATSPNAEKSTTTPRDSKTAPRVGKLIDVNSATQAELELLPDVGPALAKRIIEYRTKNGPFTNLAALDKVSGIGPKTLDKVKDRVTFGKVK
ncbi:MAG: ComEA family DNA-binding protein [Phycisphaerales bacterium]